MDSNSTKELFQCSICFETYDDKIRIPKRLFCPHTVCVVCAQSLAKGKFRIKCPFCQKLTNVSVEKLPTDLVTLQMMQMMSNVLKCADCHEFHQDISECSQCKMRECRKCLSRHRTGIHCDIARDLRQIAECVTEERLNKVLDAVTRLDNVVPSIESLENDLTSGFDRIVKEVEDRRKVVMERAKQIQNHRRRLRDLINCHDFVIKVNSQLEKSDKGLKALKVECEQMKESALNSSELIEIQQLTVNTKPEEILELVSKFGICDQLCKSKPAPVEVNAFLRKGKELFADNATLRVGVEPSTSDDATLREEIQPSTSSASVGSKPEPEQSGSDSVSEDVATTISSRLRTRPQSSSTPTPAQRRGARRTIDYHSTGTVKREIVIGNSAGYYLVDAAICQKTGRLYIAQWMELTRSCVSVLDPSEDYAEVGRFDIPSHVNAITTTSNDLLAFTDNKQHCVHIYTCQGESVRKFGSLGKADQNFHHPGGIAYCNERLYIADSFNGRVSVWTINGEFCAHIIHPLLKFVRDLVVDARGYIFVPDRDQDGKTHVIDVNSNYKTVIVANPSGGQQLHGEWKICSDSGYNLLWAREVVDGGVSIAVFDRDFLRRGTVQVDVRLWWLRGLVVTLTGDIVLGASDGPGSQVRKLYIIGTSPKRKH